jgi:hypothetical protein
VAPQKAVSVPRPIPNSAPLSSVAIEPGSSSTVAAA